MIYTIALWVLENIPLPNWLENKLLQFILGDELVDETPVGFITPNTFALIDTDDFSEHGYNLDDVVYVAGTKALPIDEEDLYLQRVYTFVHMVVDYHVDTEKMFLMDPRQLRLMDEEEQKIYYNQLELDFAGTD